MKKLLPVVSFICLSSWFGVAAPNAKTSPLDQTAGSEDMDEVIPFGMDKVMSALKPAMENQSCKVTAMTATRIECKRPRGFSGGESYGGESVTVLLEA